jgi:tRNA(Ile)-lysidine synthetase-like protein
MGKYVLAVSGGVDSVVLLDIMSKQPELELIVAHFDHGIRADSGIDAIFVAGLAKKYNLPFETKREELGVNASEDLARKRRYEFLRSVANKHQARLVTAHHADDVIETIAINLSRGTGWRGLSAMDSDIVRLLTGTTKKEIIDYARRNQLDWREDSTNTDSKYLRNRLRPKMSELNQDDKRQLLALWAHQKHLKKQIEAEIKKLIGDGPEYSRYFFIHIDEASALEILRHITKGFWTNPQMKKALHAIKTAHPGKKYEASGVLLAFSARNFRVEMLK